MNRGAMNRRFNVPKQAPFELSEAGRASIEAQFDAALEPFQGKLEGLPSGWIGTRDVIHFNLKGDWSSNVWRMASPTISCKFVTPKPDLTGIIGHLEILPAISEAWEAHALTGVAFAKVTTALQLLSYHYTSSLHQVVLTWPPAEVYLREPFHRVRRSKLKALTDPAFQGEALQALNGAHARVQLALSTQRKP